MATVFGSDGSLRGCFIAFDIDMANSLGAVVQLPESSTIRLLPDRSTGPSYPLVVTSVGFNQRERKFFMKCFGDNIYTYSFGGDVGQIQVNMVAFLAKGVTFSSEGNGTSVSRSAIVDSLNAYNSSRLSRSRESAIISLGQNGSVTGFITAMNVSTHDTESNMMQVTMNLDSVEVQGDIDNEETSQSEESEDTVVPAPGATSAALAAGALGTAGAGAAIGLGATGQLNQALYDPDVSNAAREESQGNREIRQANSSRPLSDQNADRLASESLYDAYQSIRSSITGQSNFEGSQILNRAEAASLGAAVNLVSQGLRQ